MIRSAFTLIELLVVITIIVVLLALLTPALDKAIYQAQLAMCAANLDAVATSTIVYAAEHKRRYPPREVAGFGGHPNQLSTGSWELGAYDERPVLRSMLTLDANLNDPLVDPVDLEGSKESSQVFGSVGMWFGWRFLSAGEAGMNKLGDRFTWTQFGQRNRFHVLAGDVEFVLDGGYNWSSHPDDKGHLSLNVWQDSPENNDVGAAVHAASGQTPNGYGVTWSRWFYSGARTGSRGLMDKNFVFDDGSVGRYDRLTFGESDRIVRVPMRAKMDGPQYHGYLPPN